MSVRPFGVTPEGGEVDAVEIAGGGLTARFLTWGAVLQDLRLEDHAAPLVLGFDRFEDYLAHSPYFGATAGRCANRIRGAEFDLDGARHRVDANALGGHCLHGGSAGIGKKLWRIVSRDANAVCLGINLHDGDMGFPGALSITARFSLSGQGALDIVYEATCDRPTLCNLAHHSYFVLDDTGSVLDHRLKISADHYLPADDTFCATGEVAPVAGTAWDFREGRTIRQANDGGPIDTNFCLSAARGPIRPVARLESLRSGVAMDISTTEPGLQVYDAARLNIPVPGLEGRSIGPYGGLALEPQVWPDAIHHPDWFQPVLRPGERYRQQSRFTFSRTSP